MIFLLHGDDIESSRKELNRLRTGAKGKEIRSLDGRNLTDTALTQALESGSMFGGDTLVIIENLFGKLGKKQKLVSELAEVINRSAQTDIILWEDKEVGSTVQRSLKGATVQLFKTPIALFQFLDSMRPGNANIGLALFQKTLTTHASELVHTMVIRRMRQLIMLKDNVTPDGLQGWQADRLTSQAKSFRMEKLLDMYKKLLDIEYSIKSGSSPFTLTQQLELWLINL